MRRFSGIPDLFKDSTIQYAYNQRQKIYSVNVELYNRPRILTLRMGEDFTELSIASQKGDPLEVLRQQEGRGITFSKVQQ
jgi:hypothetical protein